MRNKYQYFLLVGAYLTLGTAYASEEYPSEYKDEGSFSPSRMQNENPQRKIQLSLGEAILLAIRTNPNVQRSQLEEINQKFNLWVQKWQFYPHYALQASALYGNVKNNNTSLGSHNYNVQPGISLLTPIGTQFTLNSTNVETDHYNPGLSVQIQQPLMRGFGRTIVEANLNNARDSEVIARLSIEGVLRATVTNVINSYLDVVNAEKTLLIDQEALKRAEISVQQTRLFIKAGRKAGNELITVQANVASAKTQLENDKNNLVRSRYGLLTSIGVDPNANMDFSKLDLDKLISKYHLPPLDETKNLILENDIQYQTNQITLNGVTKRNLIVAEDNTRWQLNFTANAGTGGSSGGGPNAGFYSLINGVNESQSVGLTLQIPIDDQLTKQSLVNAKIALKESRLALMQERWNKETDAINGWNNVVSAERALRFADAAENLQLQTYNISYQKYLHGLIDSLELQTAQVQLIQAQQTSLNARIVYLKALVSLDFLIGNTLRTWNVKVRL